jgi:hypothetical protein
VTGEDEILRTRAEKGRERPLVTKFGQVTVSRIAYRAPGLPNVCPLDAALNLPEDKHSHGLRKLATIEAVRGSQVMATLRNLTIGIMKMAGHHNIAATTRHHARDAARVLAVLGISSA